MTEKPNTKLDVEESNTCRVQNWKNQILVESKFFFLVLKTISTFLHGKQSTLFRLIENILPFEFQLGLPFT